LVQEDHEQDRPDHEEQRPALPEAERHEAGDQRDQPPRADRRVALGGGLGLGLCVGRRLGAPHRALLTRSAPERSSTISAVTRRAAASASSTSSTEPASLPSQRSSAAAFTSAMSRQAIRPARNASTDTSLAADSHAGAVPPALPAW